MNKQQIQLYTSEDGQVQLEIQFEQETLWLTQAQIADLFEVNPQNVTMHLQNVYAEGELAEAATCKESLQVQVEGTRQVKRQRKTYNLDAVISVGYRVNSSRATQFRIWATQRLHEYLVKGFTLDDEGVKQAGGGNYFDELLARIRDIRSSARPLWPS